MIESIRASLGTAVVLGLKKGAIPEPPTTAYLMVGEKCINNCAFCTQARESGSEANMLSRITWPTYGREEVVDALKTGKGRFARICFQCLDDPEMLEDLPGLVKGVIEVTSLPVSVSIVPVSEKLLRDLKSAGAERIGIAMDASSPEIFDRIKGVGAGNPYDFSNHRKALLRSVRIFGKGRVSTHIIVGLGESDRDVVDLLRWCRREGILPSLFAYTPMKGAKKVGIPPPIGRYRTLQLIRHMLLDPDRDPDPEFDENGKIINLDVGESDLVEEGRTIFMTRGCPGCNRPYYNERPGGVIFNYPRPLSEEEISKAITDVEAYVGE